MNSIALREALSHTQEARRAMTNAGRGSEDVSEFINNLQDQLEDMIAYQDNLDNALAAVRQQEEENIRAWDHFRALVALRALVNNTRIKTLAPKVPEFKKGDRIKNLGGVGVYVVDSVDTLLEGGYWLVGGGYIPAPDARAAPEVPLWAYGLAVRYQPHTSFWDV